MKKIAFLSFGFLIILGVSSGPVHGADSFDAVSFKPATDHGFYLTTEGSQTLGKGKFHTGLYFDFSNESLILLNAAGNKVRDIIGNQFAAHVTAAIGITDWLNAGVLVDFIPFQDFTNPTTGTGDDGARMGDIRLDAKLRLLDTDTLPIGLSLVPFITFPTGSDSHFTGNGGFTGGGELVLETKRIGDRFSVTLNAGAQVREQTALSQGTIIDDQFLYGLGANFAINEKVELIGEYSGWTKFDDFFGDDFRSMMARGGVRLFPRPDVAITVGGGGAIQSGLGTPKYEGFLSIAYVPAYRHYEAPPPKPDSDGDGVPDEIDRCPTEAGPKGNCGCPAKPIIEIDEVTKRIKHQKIFFEFDSDQLKPESNRILEEMAKSLKLRKDITHVQIIGHTDSVGAASYNQELSVRRAKSVRDYLAGQGAEQERLSHYGKGESEPLASNDNDEGRGKNRRVEFHIDLPDQVTKNVQQACP